ncbi:MAG: ATP-binding protein [Bacteroidota bacterium]
MDARSRIATMVASRRSRFMVMAVFLLLLVAAGRLAEYLLVTNAVVHWENVSDGQCADALAKATGRFTDLQRSLRRTAADLASRQEVTGYLTRGQPGRERLFARVTEINRTQDLGVEIREKDGSVAAWDGPEGGNTEAAVRSALHGRMVSFIDRSGAASRLVVIVPVRADTQVVGAVSVSAAVGAGAPLSNSLLRERGLGERLSEELGVAVEFSFTGEGESPRDGRACASPLIGIDSVRLGSVNVMKPVRSAYLETLDARFRLGESVVLALLAGLLAMGAGELIRRIKPTLVRLIALSALIWGLRYALLFLDLPSSVWRGGIFDPALFASPFGGGLARSVGEMTITVIALALNVVLIAATLLKREGPAAAAMRIPPLAGLPLAAGITFLLYWLLRGYGAAIRSGVADSTLTYFDARVILPSPELAFMILNFFLLGASLIIAAAGMTLLILRLCAAGPERWRTRLSWTLTGLFFLTASVLFGVFQQNPLMSDAYRMGFGAIILLITYRITAARAVARPVSIRRQVLTVMAASGLVLFPLLDAFTHDRDRGRVEIFAVEELKPVDGWLKYVVEEGLQGFDNDTYRERLSEGYAADVAGIAFERWASSLACSQGYDAIFTVTDPYGQDAGRFVIGGSVEAMSQAEAMLPLGRGRMIRVRDIGTGVNALKVYSGSMPILAADSSLFGYAKVVIAAAQQSLFRGETPAILRGSSRAGIESFYRRITLSEYRDGVLLTTNDPEVPIGHTLPDAAVEAMSDTARMSVWSDDRIGDEVYETFFVRRSPATNDIVALGLRQLGLAWHIVSAVKLLAAYLLIALLIIVVARVAAMRRGEGYRVTFRDRLLLALLVTALLPLSMIALYIGVADRERADESVRRRLDEETQNVIYNITTHPDPGVTILNLPSDRYAVEQLASEIETDFNVYTDRQLRASSKQVLYDVGIFDSRLSGNAYARIVLGGERFMTQTERVGEMKYTVGYRPVLDARGDIIGVVSVPTLFRAEEGEQEIARRNAFLLGAYAIVLLAMLLIAAVLANRIARPVQQLTEATRRVARGELDVPLPHAGIGGEISDLVRAFGQMIHDLRRNREELVRYERELAWKEMAKQVAHEIKNPLTPMRLSIQHLRRTFLDKAGNFPEILDTVTRTIIEQIDTLSAIASEFSHFARMPRRTLSRVRCEEVVEEAVRLFSQETRVTFETRAEVGVSEVVADRDELRRALINIIRNGIQAMDGAGRIEISTLRRAEGVAIAVQDHGKGIPEEIRPKLFEPNFSTKTDGMGLGLAIVKKTVDDLGGTVTVDSKEGAGTTVTVWLPSVAEGSGAER